MAADPWEIDRLDLAGYLKRLGAPAREPSREALAELREAHVRGFAVDNIDVLLGQHPGGGTRRRAGEVRRPQAGPVPSEDLARAARKAGNATGFEYRYFTS